ncbi:MAG: gamma carbonic anhydrase family protein [Francisella endosymbiont of Hyalomma asiaticum]
MVKALNIQDCSTLHTTKYLKDFGQGFALSIGDYVTVGHGVVLHGCEIKNNCLIGMGSIIFDGAVVEPWVFLGAGSLVPSGKVLESGYMFRFTS